MLSSECGNIPLAEKPDDLVLKNWLYRENQKRKNTWSGGDVRPTMFVELFRPYVKPLPPALDELVVLPTFEVSAGEGNEQEQCAPQAGKAGISPMYVPVVCAGMVRTYQRCVETMLELGVDEKCIVVSGGWRIITIGVSVRSVVPVMTTLARDHQRRTQGLAFTLQKRPLMQFVVSSESLVNVTDCLKDLREFLDSVAPKAGYPPFVERIRQVHKDLALSMKSARRAVTPYSRPVDDFPHMDRNG